MSTMSVMHQARRSAAGLALVALMGLAVPAWAAAKKPSNAECLACHADATLTREVDGKQVSLGVDEAKFKASIHGGLFTCVDCHDDLKQAPHTITPAKVLCAKCHQEADQAYSHSVHAGAVRGGGAVGKQAPTCTSCHNDPHQVLPSSDKESPIFRANIPQTCSRCHAVKLVMEGTGRSTQPATSYAQSVHGRAVAGGLDKAAVCTDCHGSHEILDARDPRSKIFRFNLPRTCGQCHAEIAGQYQQSIHGQALARGNWAGGGLHRLPRHARHQEARGPRLQRGGAEPGAQRLRPVP